MSSKTTSTKPTPTVASTVKRPAPRKPVAAKAVPAVVPVVAEPVATVTVEVRDKKSKKDKKPKVIRDSFTLPQEDYALISQLKDACLQGGVHAKKSELLRAGLRLLSELPAERLQSVMGTLEKVKTGRPKSV